MTEFFGFGQLTRPDIGLVADGSQNLAEIFTSDQPTALRNIRLDPEILDIIYGLSAKISREDLRAVSGLSSLLLPTLDLQDETFERINTTLYIDEKYATSSRQIGRSSSNPSLRGDLVKVPNVIFYNGSIQCEGVQYRTKVLGSSSLYENAENRLTSISTSRASLFNSEQYGDGDGDLAGYFKTASYPSLIRVRRRSHVNRITVNKSTFIPRAPVKENPSHQILCYIDNGGTGTSQALKLLATKNSPLKIPCRMAKGKIIFKFATTGIHFFGYQVQPLQSRTIGQQPAFLPVTPSTQTIAASSYPLEIDITSTGYQNSYDLYLYLYVNPEQVTSIEMSGINVSEFIDGRDIGLVGFNNLTSLVLKDTSIKILPIWLKTLSNKLQVLDLLDDGDTYRNGLLRYFDYRRNLELPTASTPLFTVASYLTIPKKGAIVNESGNAWKDSKFENYIKSQVATNASVTYPNPRVAGTDFRAFSAMRTLRIGDRFLGLNPRLDDIFPQLEYLEWRGYAARGVWPISGTPPKINNNGKFITYLIPISGAVGNIVDIGTSTTITANTIDGATHISKYKIDAFDISGYEYKTTLISGGIATSNFSEWATWFTNTKSIDISWSNVSIGLQPTGYIWNNLQSLGTGFSGGIVFTASSGIDSDPIKAPKLTSLNVYGTSSTGPIPSLGADPTSDTSAIIEVEFGGNNTMSTIAEGGYTYILPRNFAPDRPSSPHKLTSFKMTDTGRIGRIRQDNFKYLHELTNLNFRRASGVWGKFPIFPTKKNPDEEKSISIDIAEGCRFYDLSNLNIDPSNFNIARDLVSLTAWNQNNARGGCKLPSLVGLGGSKPSKIKSIGLENCLQSTYPSNWTGTNATPGACIFDSDLPSSILAITPGRVLNTDDDIYFMTGVNDFNRKVLVNDSVHASVSGIAGVELARVVSVEASVIYLDRDIEGSSSGTYIFKRNTQSIANWFQVGFGDLNRLRLKNCRLSGSINIRAGFSKIVDDEYACLDLSENCLTGYTTGFSRIFSGSNRKITIDLSSNNFSEGTIGTMLSELLTIESQRKFTNVEIRLNNTKISSSGRYINYTQDELFPTTIQEASSQTTSLTRIAKVKNYQVVETFNEQGEKNPPTITTNGTKNITVPGAYIASAPIPGYYTKRTSGRQQIIENSLGVRLKRNKFWSIKLGFTYQSPDTSPTVTSTTYTDPITVAASLGTVVKYEIDGVKYYYTESDLAA